MNHSEHKSSPILIAIFITFSVITVIKSTSPDNTHHPSPLGDFTPQQLTWKIRPSSCSRLDAGCKCEETILNKILTTNPNSILCTCHHPNQTVKVVSEKGDFRGFQSPTKWLIRNCSQVFTEEAFIAPSINSNFTIQFQNIKDLLIAESAFETKETAGSVINVIFESCGISTLPERSFPSYLETLTFRRCQIGKLSSFFIRALRLRKLEILDSTVGVVEENAFYENTIIDEFHIEGSTFKELKSNSISSGISHFKWLNTLTDILESEALSPHVANVMIQGSQFKNLSSKGITMKDWTHFRFSNNTVNIAATHSIDLTHPSASIKVPSAITNNVWKEVEQDFIVTGTTQYTIVEVRNNSFLHTCQCDETISNLVSPNGSRHWFYRELWNNSRCALSPKARNCLLQNNFQSLKNLTPQSNFLAYQYVFALCSDPFFMCMNQVEDVIEPAPNSNLPDRLHLFLIVLGAFGVIVVLAIVATLCAICCKGKKSNKFENSLTDSTKETSCPSSSVCMNPSDNPKSLHNSTTASQHDFGEVMYKLNRPRSGIFLEDVEMEDKGVQTLPTELSAEVLDGLREKLSSDSFWDAKETLDHLYDLINRKDNSVTTSSPPDVTMCNHHSSSQINSNNTKSPEKSSLTSSQSAPLPRFAQIKPKHRTKPIIRSEESNHHVYSELANFKNHSKPIGSLAPPKCNETTLSSPSVPLNLCDYTEPKDAQSHVYAELFMNNPNSHSNDIRKDIMDTNNAIRISVPNPTAVNVASSPLPRNSGTDPLYATKDVTKLLIFPPDGNRTQSTFMHKDSSIPLFDNKYRPLPTPPHD